MLNSTRSAIALGGFGSDMLDPVAVKLVSRLARVCRADVVISSTWRLLYSMDELLDILDNYDSRLADSVVGRTPSFRAIDAPRGAEIRDYLRVNADASRKYVILDDDDDMLTEQLPHFVQTDPMVGFSAVDYERAVAILGGRDNTQHSVLVGRTEAPTQ